LLHCPSFIQLSTFMQPSAYFHTHAHLLSYIHRSIVYPPTIPSTLTSSCFLSSTRSYSNVRAVAHPLAHVMSNK